MTLKRFLVATVCFGTFATACDTTVQEAPIDLSDPSQYAAEGRRVACERAVRCVEHPDVGSCMEALKHDDASIAQVLADVASGKIAYDAEAAAACLDHVSQRECNPAAWAFPTACAEVFTGTIPAGEPCLHNSGQCADYGACVQCVGQDDCVACPTNTCCGGTCQGGIERATVGESCAQATCWDGTVCSPSSMTCVVLPGPGEPCVEHACAVGAKCTAEDMCVSLAGLGAACDAEVPGAGCDWAYTLTCEEESATCQLRPGPGEPCGGSFAGTCRGQSLRCLDGTCAWLPDVGEPCVPLVSGVDGPQPECLSGLICEQGSCAYRGSTEPCP